MLFAFSSNFRSLWSITHIFRKYLHFVFHCQVISFHSFQVFCIRLISSTQFFPFSKMSKYYGIRNCIKMAGEEQIIFLIKVSTCKVIKIVFMFIKGHSMVIQSHQNCSLLCMSPHIFMKSCDNIMFSLSMSSRKNRNF